jgi:hypothetical protein
MPLIGERRPFAAGVGSAQPWEPQAGTPLSEDEKEELRQYEAERQFLAARRAARLAAVRRYALVLLLTFIGSALGSMMTLLTLSYYH